MARPTIYEPKGRAYEYAPLACEVYRNCSHGCTYCFNVTSGKNSAETFYKAPAPVPNVIANLEREAPQHKYEEGKPLKRVLLSFSCDPYQPLNDEYGLTRQAIQVLNKHGVPFQVLSKGGLRATKDFDLYAEGNGLYAVTLLFTNEESRKKWEPNAASIEDRVESLKIAHEMGIKTWVSIEPPILVEEALDVISQTAPYVNTFKVGKWNHEEEAEKIDWKDFGYRAYGRLKEVGKPYLIKHDLAQFMGKNAILRTIPDDF